MPGGPSFSVRRPNYRKRRTVALVGFFALVFVAVLLLTRDGGPVLPGEPPIPTLAFTTTVSHINQSKAAADATKNAEKEALEKLFNDFYQQAFVDPDKWGDGTFTDLAGLFAADAKATFTKDVPGLTLGAAATELRRVDPTASTLALTVYYDTKSAPTLAVAAIRFAATGTLKKAGPKLMINQTATFYLQKQGGAWKITAYDTQETQVQPSPSPSPSGTST